MFKFTILLFCILGAQAQRGGRLLGGVEDNDFRVEEGKAEPYSFSYSADTDDGGSSAREESGDENGRVTGFYTLLDADGRQRRVEYVADENGFRAIVTTNEVGTESKNPADVIIESSAPTAEELVARYAAEFGSRTTITREAAGPDTIITRTPAARPAITVQPAARPVIRTVTRPATSSVLVNEGLTTTTTRTSGGGFGGVIGGGRRVIISNGQTGGGVIRTTTTTAQQGTGRTVLTSGGATAGGGFVLVPADQAAGLGFNTIQGGNIIRTTSGGNILRTTSGGARTFTTGTTTIRRTSAQPVATFVTGGNRIATTNSRVVVQPLTEEDEPLN